MKRRLIAFGLLILVFLLIFGCRGQVRPSPWKRARELVAIGDTREKAVDVLGSEAWYHEPCYMSERVATDLFFYGSHSYDRADIVIVRYVAEGGEYKVEFIGSFEPNEWHTAYANCIDRDRFED